MVFSNIIRRQIRVYGVVQGVGFRPWIYRLATVRELSGYVLNDSRGVLIEVEGPAARVNDFTAILKRAVARKGEAQDQPRAATAESVPPLARITGLETSDLPGSAATAAPAAISAAASTAPPARFLIRVSQSDDQAATEVSPDMAVCGDCLNELRCSRDRRYRYPFINCTNCGPRYSIILDVPYDRPRTTMKSFRMCPDCQKEYDDPLDRRFHAQPNACPVCGPQLSLLDAGGKLVRAPGHVDAVMFVREKLLAGAILVIKGLTGYHLACDARSAAAVAELRRRKHRDEKPLALMVADLEAAAELAELDEPARRLLASPERPIVLLPRKAGAPVAPAVAPRSLYLGLMLPYAPLHYLLFADRFPPLVMTSANLSEEPMVRENGEVFRRLSGIADFFLLHNRDIQTICDDSVTTIQRGRPLIIRRARGYAPRPLDLPEPEPAETILAVGPELKNSVCLTRRRQAFVSQHIGDLKNPLATEYFRQTVEKMQRLLDVKPTVVAHDLHPLYHSTRYARGLAGVRLVAVQHHHAHIASIMAEHHLKGPVLGLAMDGTGYGTDGLTWGSEFLLARPDGTFARLGHLGYVRLPGADAAIEKVVPLAYAYLLDALGGSPERAEAAAMRFLPMTTAEERQIWRRMIERGVNSPPACGLGRLFDAVSAISGVAARSSYEGQAAIELEAAIEPGVTEEFDYELLAAPLAAADDNPAPGPSDAHAAGPAARPTASSPSPPKPELSSAAAEVPVPGHENPFVIPPGPIIRGAVLALEAGESPGRVAARFHNTVARILLDGALLARRISGVDQVALSGGCFLNRYLVDRLAAALERAGFTVYLHHEVSPGDGGVALGQVEATRQRLASGTIQAPRAF